MRSEEIFLRYWSSQRMIEIILHTQHLRYTALELSLTSLCFFFFFWKNRRPSHKAHQLSWTAVPALIPLRLLSLLSAKPALAKLYFPWLFPVAATHSCPKVRRFGHDSWQTYLKILKIPAWNFVTTKHRNVTNFLGRFFPSHVIILLCMSWRRGWNLSPGKPTSFPGSSRRSN